MNFVADVTEKTVKCINGLAISLDLGNCSDVKELISELEGVIAGLRPWEDATNVSGEKIVPPIDEITFETKENGDFGQNAKLHIVFGEMLYPN